MLGGGSDVHGRKPYMYYLICTDFGHAEGVFHSLSGVTAEQINILVKFKTQKFSLKENGSLF